MNDIRSTVDEPLSPSALRRIDDLCGRFEDAWQEGQRPRIGDYLKEAEELERDRLLRELIALDIDYRRLLGEKPEAGDYHEYAPSLGNRWLERLTGANRYELVGQIGRGGMGDVLQGYDRHLRRDLAVKMLRPEHQDHPHMVRRFLREAWIGARLQHPGIVPVYDLGEFSDRQPYFTMKLVRGRTLKELLKERANPAEDLPHFLTIFEQVCQTMAYAHAQGVIHRDLKPANIMVGAFGEVQIMDWGLAKVLDWAWGDGPITGRDAGASARTMESTDPGFRTQAGQAMGTYAYMPPEQARGEVDRLDERSDVFGLGAILCEILIGAPPFRGQNAEERLERSKACDHREAMARLDDCGADAELLRLAKACLAAEPADRPRNAGAVAEEVKAYLAKVQELLQVAERERAAAEARAQEAKRTAAAERRTWRRTMWAAAAVLFVTTAGFTATYWQYLETKNEGRQKDIALGKVKEALANETQAKQAAKQAQEEEKIAKNQAQEKEREAIRRLVQMHVAKGVRQMEDGDYFGALPWLAAALAEERDPELRDMHRYRLGSILRAMPRLVHLLGHPGEKVKHAEFSRDGRLLLTVGDQSAKLWDLATGEKIHSLNRSPVAHATFSPDSRRVVTASADGTARVWAVTSGKELVVLRHDKEVRYAVFSPNGERIVTTSDDSTARIWDLEKTPPTSIILPHPDSVRHAAFSSDGVRVATVCSDGKARVWNASSGIPVTPFLPVNRYGRRVEFSPNGRLVAVAGGSQALVADAATGRTLFTVPHGHWVYVAAFSPDGQRIVTSSLDFTARLSSISGGKIAEVKHQGAAYFAAFSPDGRRFVTSGEDTTARIWDSFTGQPITPPLKHANVVSEATFSPDSRFLVTAGWDGAARVWDLAAGAAETPRITRNARFWRISPDRQRMATVEANQTVRIWDLESGQEVCPALSHGAAIYELSFDTDGRRLFTNGADGVARMWDVASGKQIGVPLRHGRGIIRVCLSPDGRQALTGGEDNQVRRWDLATGREVGPMLPHGGAVYWCQFSRDGRLIVTASRDNKARVWDAASGRPLTPPLQHEPLERFQDDGPVLSPNDRLLVTHPLGFEAQIWDVETGQRVGPPLRHSGGVSSISFRPDGRRILTTGYDTRAVQWDAATGKQLLSSLRHDRFVTDGVYSPDGRRIATSSFDGTARIWDAATGLPLSPPLRHLGTPVSQLWFTPDGRRLVTQCRNGAVRSWDVSPDDRSPEEWGVLAQVLTSHLLDANGALLPLENDELLKSWEIACSHRPADFAAALQETPAWQQRQAEAAEASGQWFAVAFHWDRLLAAQPDNALWHLHRGRARMRLGQHAEALEDFDQAIAKGEATPDMWTERAAIYSAQRQWEKAAADYSQAITLRDNRSIDWSGRGHALAELGRWDEAARDFGRAIELGQATLPAYRNRAYACLAAGQMEDFRKARAAILRRFHKDENFAAALTIGHLFFLDPGEADEFKDLLRTLERAAAKYPNTCTYYHVLGPVTSRAGRQEAAVKHLNEAVRLHTKGGGLPTDWLFLALAHQQLGHAEEAQRWLTKATTYLDRFLPDKLATNTPPSSFTWSQRLELRLLRREVEQRIKLPAKNDPAVGPAGKDGGQP